LIARTLRAMVMTLAIVASPAGASAALGGDVSSVEADRVRMHAALLRTVRVNAYTLTEIQSSSGTTIREYVSSTGTVFAVAWQGPWPPDLRQVLGPYFAQYQRGTQAAQQHRKSRGSLLIQDAGLVVQVSGHPRAFFGRAYVPNLMPPGVQASAIQ
jgi:hypothetical protein